MTQETQERLTEAELTYARKARNRLNEAVGELENLAIHMRATRGNTFLAHGDLQTIENMAVALRTPIHNLRVLIAKQDYIQDSDDTDKKDANS